MPMIKIDNKDYDLDTLPDEAKQQLGQLSFCDQEQTRLNMQLAAIQTARAAYARALQEILAKHQTLNSDMSLV